MISLLGACSLRFAALVLSVAPALAAFCSTASSPSDPRHDFQFFAGYSPAAAVLLQPGQYLPQYVAAHAVYGFAVTPVGFTAEFGRRRKVHPFLQTNEGIIASSEPIPINVIGATSLNFLIDVGGGIRIRTGARRAITLGYKFLHISNGFTSAVNPGVDNNVFYAGFSILK